MFGLACFLLVDRSKCLVRLRGNEGRVHVLVCKWWCADRWWKQHIEVVFTLESGRMDDENGEGTKGTSGKRKLFVK